MRSLSDVPDSVLMRDLMAFDCRDRRTLVELLRRVAEVDQRRLYAPAGHSSMYAFCTEEMHWSEDVAFKRIRVARLARRFPMILQALGNGGVHLSAMVVLGPHLTRDNVRDLLTAATHKSRKDVERLVAGRFHCRTFQLAFSRFARASNWSRGHLLRSDLLLNRPRDLTWEGVLRLGRLVRSFQTPIHPNHLSVFHPPRGQLQRLPVPRESRPCLLRVTRYRRRSAAAPTRSCAESGS